MRIARSVLLIVLLAAACSAQQRITPGSRPDDARTMRDFEGHVSHYLSMRKKLETSGATAKTAAEARERRDQLAARVAQHRADAHQGDIFTPQVTEYFKRQLGITLSGPDGKRIWTSLAHAEPVQGLTVQVNRAYPDDVPLQSTPPSLLLNLPRLPKDLQYRIVGRDLILYDSATNLIVDFIPQAMPSSKS